MHSSRGRRAGIIVPCLPDFAALAKGEGPFRSTIDERERRPRLRSGVRLYGGAATRGLRLVQYFLHQDRFPATLRQFDGGSRAFSHADHAEPAQCADRQAGTDRAAHLALHQRPRFNGAAVDAKARERDAGVALHRDEDVAALQRDRLERRAREVPAGGAAREAEQGAARIGVRPEHIAISTTAGEWKGTVGVAEHLGSDTFVHVHTDGQGTINVRASGDVSVNHGDTVYLTPDERRLHRFDAEGRAMQ